MARIIVYGLPEDFPNYYRALRWAGAEVVWTGQGAAAENCDALLLPGGGDIAPWRMGAEPGMAAAVDEARDEVELALLAHFLREKKPVLGVCRGVQVLNAALGGDLYQHVEGHNCIDGADRAHRVTTLPGSRMARLYGGAMTVNSAHHQALKRLGRGLYVTQWAPDGVIEAVEHEALPIWGVQWHPERLRGPKGQKVYDLFVAEVDKIICRK